MGSWILQTAKQSMTQTLHSTRFWIHLLLPEIDIAKHSTFFSIFLSGASTSFLSCRCFLK